MVLALGCSRLSFYADSAKEAKARFPENTSGWSKQGETRSFNAGNLYEYLDGGADRYLKAGVKQVLTADYRFAGKTDAVADIFVMGTTDGAKTASQYYRDARCLPTQIGDEGSCLFPGSLEFRKGVYLVHVVAYPSGSDFAGPTDLDIVELGKAIAERLR